MHKNLIFKKETVQMYPSARFMQFISEMLFDSLSSDSSSWPCSSSFAFVVFLQYRYTATYWSYDVNPERKKTISENWRAEYLI